MGGDVNYSTQCFDRAFVSAPVQFLLIQCCSPSLLSSRLAQAMHFGIKIKHKFSLTVFRLFKKELLR